MPRTADQVAADDALTQAIEGVRRAYTDDGLAWVASEYLVVAAEHRFDDQGDTITAVAILYRDGDVPTHRALGLVEYAGARLRAYATDAESG